MSEKKVQDLIRVEAAASYNSLLMRNNSGAAQTKNGFIRFGLGNDSPEVNKNFKSHDLIGITPIWVTEKMVGRYVGVFTSVEVKSQKRFNLIDDTRLAQERFKTEIERRGGISLIVDNVEQFHKYIQLYIH